MTKLEQPQGKLGVLMPGLGAVATTFIAGVLNARRELGKPIGSLTQMGRLDPGGVNKTKSGVPINEFVPLAGLDDLVFGGWDIYNGNIYDASRRAGVLNDEHLAPIKDELSAIEPMKAVFDPTYVKRLDGPHVKTGANKMALAEQLRQDIQRFKETHQIDRMVMIWCGSTEIFIKECETHATLEAFEAGMRLNSPDISPSMIYAYAALMEGIPYLNGAPNLSVDIRALSDLARERNIPVAGKDFKTGQTLIKTILAPGLKARLLGIEGWFSTNLLGNQDGIVLEDPGSFKTKEETKLGVLDYILEPDLYPDLYQDFFHKVRINYYPPRGDNKEGWDNIDIVGWLGYPMQIKVNFLCRDSILAAPIVLDLVLLTDLAQRAGLGGVQEWLSFYFKAPMWHAGSFQEHDLFVQLAELHHALRRLHD